MMRRADCATMRAPLRTWIGSSLACLATCSAAAGQPPARIVEVDRVWSGHPVQFGLTHGNQTYFLAYYDAERRMTVASLPAAGSKISYQKLDSVTGWDSHNYLAVAVDGAGHLHVIGNMHNDPLVYFRSTRAGDVHSLERVP